MSNRLDVHIRWMIQKDRREVLEIENACFEFPRTLNDLETVLRDPHVIGLVAELGDAVVGYVVYKLYQSRLYLMNLAVSPYYQRREIGRQLVEKLIGKLGDKRQRITLEVRETNLAAQLLFQSCGFRAVNVLRSFYEDTPEDAYVMQYKRGRPFLKTPPG